MINNRDPLVLKEFGNNLRKLRKERGFSQEKLSLQAGISKNQIGNIERGEVNITLGTLAVLAKTFNISLKELFDY
ncbi:MAG: helix-turn-helix transcriptional regulator [Daejeonella sp.]|uniref:helix-turn-helix domain-containing protein n=1 Tax=Daejeonella sp. TaxID=2805397 RepID=UPI002735D8E9|nr:helix-turn-helix transcriptional regulator [Daejeonella sp.]MDP3469462.1 helix-turn-helix transcriptional regulator [Daejeonella sp.]